MKSVRALLTLLALASCGEALVGLDPPRPALLAADAALSALDAGPDAADAALDPGDGGGPADGSSRDAGPAADAGGPADAGGQLGQVLYLAGRDHSPITPDLAARLREIAARGPALRDELFSKVGDSNTVNPNFLHCFAGTQVDLAGRTHLQPTLDLLGGGDAAGASPFTRTSLAATVGWSAWAALAGSPSPLDQEVSAISPRLAVVLYGTNDLQSRDLARYGRDLLGIVDRLIALGVVPLVTSVPPRDDSAEADLWVPRYSAVARGLAQARGVPFLDLERQLRALSDHGLGPDGLHLTTSPQRGCAFGAEGLRYGFNLRNLLTLESLHRALSVLHFDAAAPDAQAPRLAGKGSASEPFLVPGLPFTDWRDTAREGERLIGHYDGCAPGANEGGPELYYRLEVTTPITLRATVLSQGGADVDLHLLSGSPEASVCVARHDQVLSAALSAGTWYLALDTYVDAGVEQSGEYLFTVLAE